MTYRIEKAFAFSASHRLFGLPEGHQCGRLHGHNYEVKVRLTSDYLDTTGFVLDYGLLAPVKRYIDDTLDHRHLNDVLNVNPTAEHLAAFLADRVLDAVPMPSHVHVAVGVSETPKTWAWYE